MENTDDHDREDEVGDDSLNQDTFTLSKSDLKEMMESIMEECRQQANKNQSIDASVPLGESNSNMNLSALNSPGLSSVVVGSTTSSLPPSAIEEKNQLPSSPQLQVSRSGSPTTEMFKKWYDDVMLTVQGYPKYRPLLAGDAQVSWKAFQQANAKHSPASLELPYLDAQRGLWMFICKGLDYATRQQVGDGMKIQLLAHNLPMILGFKERDDLFYQDCYSLMQKLQERFQVKSTWRGGHLVEQYDRIRYNEGTDPLVFLSELSSLENQLASLTDYIIQPDSFRAILILTRLPASMESVRSQFYNAKPTVEQVQGALTSYWLAHKPNMPRGFRLPYSSPASANAASDSAPHDQRRNNNNKFRFKRGSGNYDRNSGRNQSNNQSNRGGKRNESDRHAAVGNDVASESSEQKPKEGKKVSFLTIAYEDSNDGSNNHVAASSTNKVGRNMNNKNFPDNGKLMLDSGANVYVSGRKDLLKKTKLLQNPMNIGTLGGDKQVQEAGLLAVSDKIELKNVLHLPNAPYSLMSVGLACQAGSGYESVFNKDGAWICPSGTLNIDRVKAMSVMNFQCENNLYVHELPSNSSSSLKRSRNEDETSSSSALATTRSKGKMNNGALKPIENESSSPQQPEEQISNDESDDDQF
jgi:hypothetical protein